MKRKIFFMMLLTGTLSFLFLQCSDDEKGILEGTKWKLYKFNDELTAYDIYNLFTGDSLRSWSYDDEDECYDFYSARYKINGDVLYYWDDSQEDWYKDPEFSVIQDSLILHMHYDQNDFLSFWIKTGFDQDEFNDNICEYGTAQRKQSVGWANHDKILNDFGVKRIIKEK